MKQLLEAVMAKLEWDVPQLQWIDMNAGQMNHNDPPVQFPCALVDFSRIEYRNLTESIQTCELFMEVELHVEPVNPSATPTPVSVASLEHYEVAESVYKALQGVAFDSFSPLSCIETVREKGEHARYVILRFSCMGEDSM